MIQLCQTLSISTHALISHHSIYIPVPKPNKPFPHNPDKFTQIHGTTRMGFAISNNFMRTGTRNPILKSGHHPAMGYMRLDMKTHFTTP